MATASEIQFKYKSSHWFGVDHLLLHVDDTIGCSVAEIVRLMVAMAEMHK